MATIKTPAITRYPTIAPTLVPYGIIAVRVAIPASQRTQRMKKKAAVRRFLDSRNYIEREDVEEHGLIAVRV